MNNKELERRVYKLEKWIHRLYKAVKIIQEKTEIELIETKNLFDIPPHDPDLDQNFEKKLY